MPDIKAEGRHKRLTATGSGQQARPPEPPCKHIFLELASASSFAKPSVLRITATPCPMQVHISLVILLFDGNGPANQIKGNPAFPQGSERDHPRLNKDLRKKHMSKSRMSQASRITACREYGSAWQSLQSALGRIPDKHSGPSSFIGIA